MVHKTACWLPIITCHTETGQQRQNLLLLRVGYLCTAGDGDQALALESSCNAVEVGSSVFGKVQDSHTPTGVNLPLTSILTYFARITQIVISCLHVN